MLNEPETTELVDFLEDQSKDQKEDASTKHSDYNQLKGIATLGLNVALFSNTVADMKNFYDMKEINDSADVNTVLWLLRLSFCFQVCVAMLAILMYMINRHNEKEKKKKELTKRKQRSPFRRSTICYGLSLYQMLYLTTLFFILIITTFQIIASIWSASLGIELKSAMKPNVTTAMETAI